MKRSERTHADLLDAAWTLISREGAAVSMSDIAAAAGVTRQSVYVHFGSRGGLLVALVRRADERFDIWNGFSEAMALDDPRSRLDACVSAWLDFVPKIHPVASDLIRLRASDHDAAAAWADRMSELHAFFHRLIVSLARDGALAAEWTEASAADYLWAAVSVQMWELLVRDRGWSPADAAEAIGRSVRMALLAPPA